MKRIWSVLAGALLGVGLLSAPVLAASTPAGMSGEWGGTSWSSGVPYNTGMYDYANTPSMSYGDTNYFGVWEATNNSASLANWVFVGYTNNSNNATYYVWADLRPNLGVYYHSQSSGPAIGTSHAYETQYLGNNSWGVYVDFTQIGTSTSNPPGSYSAFAGSNDPGYQGTTGTFSNQTNQSLEYLSNGSWYYWSGGTIVHEGLFTAQYTNGYYNEEESE